MSVYTPILSALALQAKSEPVPEVLADEAAAAGVALAWTKLTAAGMSDDQLDRLFDRPFQVVLAWENDTLDIQIVWDGPESKSVAIQA